MTTNHLMLIREGGGTFFAHILTSKSRHDHVTWLTSLPTLNILHLSILELRQLQYDRMATAFAVVVHALCHVTCKKMAKNSQHWHPWPSFMELL